MLIYIVILYLKKYIILVKESEKVLQVLESKTAPLVKKRHLMSVVFGDYRKLMKKKWIEFVLIIKIWIKN